MYLINRKTNSNAKSPLIPVKQSFSDLINIIFSTTKY
jgi:hypothetical protein